MVQKELLIYLEYGLNNLKINKMKETLEEAAENYVRNEFDATIKLISKYSFKDNAKWQAERMYSEEEVLEILEHHTKYLETFIYQYIDKNDMEENKIWFEQFKKNNEK